MQQSSSPFSALGSILKRNSGSRTSLNKKDAARSPFKTKTKNSLDTPTSETRLGSEPPQSLTPNIGGLFRSLRRSNSNANVNPKMKKKKKNKNGDFDDTSSIVSLPIHYALDETFEPMVTEPTVTKSKISPMRSVAVPSMSSFSAITASPNTSSHNEDKKKSPPATSSPQKVCLRDAGTSSSSKFSKRKTTDSAIFKDDSFETLFGSDSLFDSGELDKLLGKKEEKASEIKPEDKSPAKQSSKGSEEKNVVLPLNNSVSKSSMKSNSYLPMNLSTKAEKKRSTDYPRLNIKSQLHRYESNSKASKDDSLFASPSSSAVNDGSKLKDVGDNSTLKSMETSSEKKKMPLLFEEEEEYNLFAKPSADENKKTLAEVNDNSTLKSTMRAAGSSAKETKAPLLFEDEEDSLFGKPSTTTKKNEDKKDKKEKLFEDDLFGDELPCLTEEKSIAMNTKESTEKTDAKSDAAEKKKKLHEIFGDPLDLDGGMSENSESKKEEEEKKKSTRDIFGDPLDLDSGVSTKPKDKKEDKQTIFGEPMFTGISQSDTITEENQKKKSSLFDEVEDDDSSLFISKFRSRSNFGRESPTAEEEDSLFSYKKLSGRKSTQEAEDMSVTEAHTDKKIESASPEKVVVEEKEKEDAFSKETIVATDKKSSDGLLLSDSAEVPTSSKRKEHTEKAAIKAKPAPKVARKPQSTLSSSSKEDSSMPNEDESTPSWKTGLKKRKEVNESIGPAAAEQKKVKDVPDWQKKALEREKKEIRKAGVIPKTDNESPSSEGKSPPTSRKSRLENWSPDKSSADTSGTSNRHRTDSSAEENDEKLSTERSGSNSPTRYKTRREREREAKEQEEQEKEKDAALESSQIKEEKSTYKIRKEREREAQEKENGKLEEPEELSPYKTRRQREREAAMKLEVDAMEVESRYKTDSSVKETEEAFSPASTKISDSSPTRYKTRRESEREAEEHEKENEAELESTQIEEVKSTYKTRKEREKENKDKENAKLEELEEKFPYLTRRQREREAAKKLEEKESKKGGVDVAEVRPRYKTRKEREREAKEKEERSPYKTRREREREAKEKEERENKKEIDKGDVRSPYKTRREREKEAKEKEERENKKETDKGDVRSPYKTRREREKEAKDKEERENKKETDKGDVKSSYKTRRESEMEENEKEVKGDKKETDTYESGYKSRRQREREERERASNSTSLNETRTSSSGPMLDDKSSNEAISQRIRSTRRSSYTSADTVKSSPTKRSSVTERSERRLESAKKTHGETEDDVFGSSLTEGRKSPSINLESPAMEFGDTGGTMHISPKGKTDVISDDSENLVPLKSPRTHSGSCSTKSSLSSERDLTESSKLGHSPSKAISRSPTPPSAVATKTPDSVPVWKKKIAEKKKSAGSSAIGKTASTRVETASKDDKLPPWKKELLAKKKTKGDAKVMCMIDEPVCAARLYTGIL